MSTANEATKRHRHIGGTPSISTSVLRGGTNARINNSSFTVINNIQPPDDALPDLLKTLYERVEPNAILNAGGRADEVRCYPGTREEVIGLAKRWMDAPDSATPNLMWLSGPAGAGKSAIVQTIVEQCKEREVKAASFFFFRSDTTRSTSQPLVATLLYQIFKFYPTARHTVGSVLSDDPLLLDLSVQEQFERLLFSPLQDVQQPPEIHSRRPIVLLIDGLDECDSDNTSSQKQILQALDHLVSREGSPFLALVASRAEPHLTMAFKHLVSPVQSIFLDAQYQPEKDIRLFVTAEFGKVKESHHLAHTLSNHWPSNGDIEFIVKKSSGQFIFAATVMRYLVNSSASPKISLERVQGIVPVSTNTPFAHLDAIYTYIFSRVDDLEAVLDLVAMQLLKNSTGPFLDLRTTLHIYNPRYTPEFLLSCAADLMVIMQFNGHSLKFFHESLPDFLQDQSRAGEYFIDLYAFGVRILPTIPMMAPKSRDATHMGLKLLRELKTPTPDITKVFLTFLPHPELDPTSAAAFVNTVCQSIHRLYYPDDANTYRMILRRWISWYASLFPNFDPVNALGESRSLPNVTMYIWMSQLECWFSNALRAPS